MSTLFLGSELQSLAVALADGLAAQQQTSDFFAPISVVVPNRSQRQWLRLFLARRHGVFINVRFRYLEDALWDLLRDADPRTHPAPPESLDEDAYRLMVLAVLLEDRDPTLAALQQYAQLDGSAMARLSCRRAWHLADRLSLLIRDYEYDRQDALIQPWLVGKLGLRDADPFHRSMELAQRTLFARITEPESGRRALLSAGTGRNVKTFPQYAMEVMEQRSPRKPDSSAPIHFFGLTHVNALHMRVLHWLGRLHDIRFYHLNVLAGRHGRKISDGEADPAAGLLETWGRAGAEAMSLVKTLLENRRFRAERLEPGGTSTRVPAEAPPLFPDDDAGPKPATVLARLQDQVLGRSSSDPLRGSARPMQDTSLQIVACPGAASEVETVHNSILHNLNSNPTLRQTDIAVLVTDMDRYRPILQAAFERPPIRLKYGLVDFSAASQSLFGQALLGMLDLALETFTRARVFEVLLGPCFLARLGVDRAQALVWLEWAETLGVCQGWDAAEKQEQGYPPSPFFAWRLALQRLRLGRYMEVAPDEGEEPAPRFEHIVPFADIHCTDREQLDTFCTAVESLLPRLAELRRQYAGGQQWADILNTLVSDFLDVPEDGPEEEQVRREITRSLEKKLPLWDYLRPADAGPAGMPLAMVREFVLTQLEALGGRRGEYLSAGVTLASLQPMRPIPFRIVYMLGLDADLFPGSNALSSLDLRGFRREPGDVRPAEAKRYLLLENLLAAQEKIYLLYNCHDLAKDQKQLPAVPLTQLQRHLSDHITREEFHTVELPRGGDAAWLFEPAEQPDYQDVLVQYRDVERLVVIAAAERAGRVQLDPAQKGELHRKTATLKVDFATTAGPKSSATTPITLSIGELRRFLHFPAYASLRRHLRVDDEEEPTVEAEEPLVTPDVEARRLERQVIEQVVRRAALGDAQQALADWPSRFRAAFDEGRLRCRVPEDAFGEIDADALHGKLHDRIHGRGGIAGFLRRHAKHIWCGPALIGESYTPIGARTRFPAFRLRPGHELPEGAREIRIVGSTPMVWLERDRVEVLTITTSANVDRDRLCRPMLEPLLFYLTLLASTEPNGKGVVGRQWLARRRFDLHLAYGGGMRTWSYPPGLISPDEAQRYLIDLATDLLDPAQLDLLPFQIVTQTFLLRRAYDEASPSVIAPADYVEMVEEALADKLDYTFDRSFQMPQVVELAGAKVPADALVKVRRRFGLLDRGPAQLRRATEDEM